ncbi:MAG: amino acid ABC transporter substrate-binding protein [Magnetovibrionaceae bacterium]
MKKHITSLLLALCLLGSGATETFAGPGDTIKVARERGYLICGVVRNGLGLAETDDGGDWRGFFPDWCRAFGAAIMGDPDKVRFVELTMKNRLEAVRDGVVDVLTSNTTHTLGRDQAGLDFPGYYFYDGQGFMVPSGKGWTSLADVEAGKACVLANSTTLKNLEDLTATRKPGIEIKVFSSQDGLYSAFFGRQCDIVTNDRLALASQRVFRAGSTKDFVILDDTISKEPLGPAVADTDPVFTDAIRWVVRALISAEELGVESVHVLNLREAPPNPAIARLLGVAENVSFPAMLDKDWAFRAIRAVGHYGELFGRHFGPQSPIGLARGQNDLWFRGGQLYSPPMR